MYEPHEYCLAFPEMPAEQFQRLAADIRANGLLHEIVLYEGKILDGRHRYKACLQERVEARTRDYVGSDPAGFVASENSSRRHLTESQLAMVGARLAEVEGQRARERQIQLGRSHGEAPLDPCGSKGGNGRTTEIIGDKLGIGKNTVQRAIKVTRKGEPEVVKAVEQGRMTVNEAARVVDLNAASQRRVAAIDDKRQRSHEISKATHFKEAAEARVKRQRTPVQVNIPGTRFIRQFLGRLEHMATDMDGQFQLRTAEQIADLFMSEFDWNEEQLRSQLKRVTPLLLGISLIYDGISDDSARSAG